MQSRPSSLQILPLLLDRNRLPILPCPLTSFSQLLQVFSLQEPLALIFYHALWIGEEEPREDGTDGCDGAEKKEDETLSCVTLVCGVDAVHYYDGYDAAQFAGGCGYSVACTSIACWENFSGDDKGKCVCA